MQANCHGLKVMAKLGAGSFGTVYAVLDSRNTMYAMKDVQVPLDRLVLGVPSDAITELEIMLNWPSSRYVTTAKTVFFNCNQPIHPVDMKNIAKDTGDDDAGDGDRNADEEEEFEGRMLIIMDLATLDLANWIARRQLVADAFSPSSTAVSSTLKADAKQFIKLSGHFLTGLDHLHSLGLAHLDFKPENVLLFEEGNKTKRNILSNKDNT